MEILLEMKESVLWCQVYLHVKVVFLPCQFLFVGSGKKYNEQYKDRIAYSYCQFFTSYASWFGIFHVFWFIFLISSGKLTNLDLGNNEIGTGGAFHIAEYIKKTKSLAWLGLYMNDIGDEV